MKKEIKKVVTDYLQAFYQQDYDKMIGMFYEEDKIEFRNVIVDFAEKMDVFGETDDLLKKLGLTSLSELTKLNADEFILAILKMVTKSVEQEDLKRMIKGTEIISIDEAELLTIVRYEIPFKYFGDWDKMEKDLAMIQTAFGWKIFFRSGLRVGLEKYQKEIDQYYERKSKDQISKIENEEDLTSFTISGYKNSKGEVVIEPRFKYAGDFSNGLAYVQIMRKY